jgi:glycosyltransferase involved in cell wall biosynthesis
MKIVAIAASKVPSTTANSMQVMKTCQALVDINHDINLILPLPRSDTPRSGFEGSAPDLRTLYGLKRQVPIQWLNSIPGLRRYDFAWRATLCARSLRAELTYCWLIQAAFFSILFRVPVILEMHGPPEGSLGPWLFKLFLKLPGKKRIIFITHALQKLVEQRFQIAFTSENALVAPNGVDLERYPTLADPSEARRVLGLPEQFTAVYSGHLYSGRGMGLMLELARKFPQVHFLWVGGNPQDIQDWRDVLASQAVQNVHLVGFIPNEQLAKYQLAGDVLLMPYERTITGSSGGNSVEYCSPMKMFEYMACRRPILASDLPVIREVLNEKNALLCQPENLESWSSALERILMNPELGLHLASQAWDDVQAFTWNKRAERSLAGFMDEEASYSI